MTNQQLLAASASVLLLAYRHDAALGWMARAAIRGTGEPFTVPLLVVREAQALEYEGRMLEKEAQRSN